MKRLLTLLGILGLLFTPLFLSAQRSQTFWQDISADEAEAVGGARLSQPTSARDLQLDITAVRAYLSTAPQEFNAAHETLTFSLPTPSGDMETFALVETHILPPALAARYPMIKTYLGRGIENPVHSIRVDIGEMGLHALVLAPQGGYYLEPRNLSTTTHYHVYYGEDLPVTESLPCGTTPSIMPNFKAQLAAGGHSHHHTAPDPADEVLRNNSGADLYVYNLAVASDYLYSNFVTAGTPTTAAVLSQITTTINQVNAVYERDLTIRFVLNDNQDQMIFLDAMSDPYVNNGFPELMIVESPAIFDNILGITNYDVGHAFTIPQIGALAQGIGAFQSICATGPGDFTAPHKANGVSGNVTFGLPFLNTVLHELGHQFDGHHAFNFCNGPDRDPTHAFEPGSGTTIMSYAGICGGNNLQSTTDTYFNVGNYVGMFNFSRTGALCADILSTDNNPPVVDGGLTGTFVPISTPFELTMTGSDPDGDALTYCWEQQDLGPATSPNSPIGSEPLFRSYPPTTDSTRIFPRLPDLLVNTTSFGERLPTYSRTMTFRATVRDNHPGAGGLSYDLVNFYVTDDAGPFLVTFPNVAINLIEGSLFEIQWDPASTELAPVSCDSVEIYMSSNGGQDFDILLSAGTPNDGSFTTFVPNIIGNNVNRVKVKALGNIFFDISNFNFSIGTAPSPDLVIYAEPELRTVCPNTTSTFELFTSGQGGFNGAMDIVAINAPAGVTFSFDPVQPMAGDTVLVTITGDATVQPGASMVTLAAQASGGGGASDIQQVDLEILPGTVVSPTLYASANGNFNQSLTPTLSWAPIPGAIRYRLQVSATPNFSSLITDQPTLTDTTFTVSSGLTASGVYYWRVSAENECGFGGYSDLGAFQTGDCAIFESTDVPTTIPLFGQPSVATSALTINSNTTISDLNVVNLRGTHTSISDLTVSLSKAGGPDVVLFSNICTADDEDFDLGFDDEAGSGAIACPPTNGAAYQSIDALSAFDNSSAAGTYTLTISDAVNFDGGELESWGLEICSDALVGPDLITNDTLFVMLGQQGTLDNSVLNITDTNFGPGDISLTFATLPNEGVFFLNGVPVSLGDIITQADINSGNLVYNHTGVTLSLDEVVFSVANAQGGWLGMVPVPIKITNTVSIGAVAIDIPSVYPNPAQAYVQVMLPQQVIQAKLSLINQQGQVLQQANTSDTYRFQVEDYPAGLYLVRVQAESATWTVRVVIE